AGAGRSRSRHACWSAPAMIAVESASVPSQSKTSNRNRRGVGSLSIAIAIAVLRFVKARDEFREIRRQWRLDGQHSFFSRMRQRQSPGVQEHPLQALFRERPVPGKVAVLVVARQRKPEM